MKQIEVQIMGQSYLLGCPEGGDAQLLAAVQRVDVAMCKIRDGGKVRARDRIAVLAALNLAFDLAEIPAPSPSRTTPQTTSVVSVSNSTTTVASGTGALSGTDHATLNSLLARLDTALNDDGRLL